MPDRGAQSVAGPTTLPKSSGSVIPLADLICDESHWWRRV